MAFSTIVAGYDLSPPGEAALTRAVTVAEQHGARLVVVNAQADDHGPGHHPKELVEQLGAVKVAVAEAEAMRLDERCAAIVSRGVTCEIVRRAGPPGEVLEAVATELDADLIVVGTHGHTGLARFLLGSVATATLRHAPCDVLVCRGAGTGPFAKPLVAMDFSAAATRAIAHTAELVRRSDAIELVHAWQLPAGSWGATLLGQARFPWSTVRDAVVASANTRAERLVAEQKALGRAVHVELVQGPPANVVTSFAERGGHDLIAVGTHGHRGFRRLLLGSVAEDVIRYAPCSVYVVHGEHAGETSKFEKV